MNAPKHAARPLAITPDPGMGLVAREAFAALPAAWEIMACPAEELAPERLARNLALPSGRSAFARRPSLFCTVNFRGLDKHGEAFALWQAKGVPVAVWCVDNPWNLISGLRDAFWKKVRLFVTDSSFIPGLVAHGAEHATFLPLGTDPGLFNPAAAPVFDAGLNPVVFAGRSQFPDKDRFFMGQSLPPALLREAQAHVAAGGRADFFWWLKRLGLDNSPLWPGSAARKAGLGAEECSFFWRLRCLLAALPCGLTLYGDAGWRRHIPEQGTRPDLRPPLDYYGSLAGVYRAAEFSLTMTSFLLPHGLNQRHFDIWAAGGFSLLDASPGLDLFPGDLAAPVTFTAAEEIPELIAAFRKNPRRKKDLARLWRDHIRNEHSYTRRMQSLLATIFS